METPYELLIKYCKKETSPEESQQVEKWLAEGDNLSLFLELKQEWRHLDNPTVVTPDKRLLWRKIQNRTYLQNRPKTIRYRKILTVAAAILIAFIGSVSFYLVSRTPDTNIAEKYTTINTQTDEKTQIELADGTQVWLNANSTLSFNEQFNLNERYITASGELFFNVAKSAKKFIINTGKVKIEVLGTSFNLKTTEDNNVEIALITGKVAVKDAETDRQLFVMDTAQYAVISKTDMSYMVQTKNTENSNVWTQKNLSMYNEPLSKIMEKLEAWYNIKISYSGLNPNEHYTFHIQNESLTEFLTLFSAITPINYNITDNKVYIEAKSPN